MLVESIEIEKDRESTEAISTLFEAFHHSMEKYIIGTTLQPPTVVLDYVTHLAVIKG